MGISQHDPNEALVLTEIEEGLEWRPAITSKAKLEPVKYEATGETRPENGPRSWKSNENH